MADNKRIKQQEIPFILDGQRIVKIVTKNTTCSDVIKKLPNLFCPLAVFECVDGVEKELSGKTKLLKVWRAHGPNKKVEFIIKKARVQNKWRKSASNILANIRKREQPCSKRVQGKELSKETLKQVSDLAFFARYQKTKVDAMNKKSKGDSVTSEQEKLIRRMSSRASVNSMYAFLAKTDLDEMARFLSFCGGVTAEKLRQKVPKQQTVKSRQNSAKENNFEADKSYSITSLKLGLKETCKVKSTVTRTTSTGTISSTETGYQSAGSEDTNASETKPPSQSGTGHGIAKRHTFIFSNGLSGPRNSTPILASRSQKRTAADTDRTFIGHCTITSDKLKYLDEGQGKNIILQRFMNDQNIPASMFIKSDVATTSSVKRQRRDRHSTPVFSYQKERCRFLWDQYCDSDSDSESETSKQLLCFDIAYHAETTSNQETTLQSRHKTLRRESAVSNLNRFSLISGDAGLDMCNHETSFDYSFDCTFPRMDESQFSLDLRYSFDDSESEAKDSDHSVDIFVKTRLFEDVTDDVTILV